ncbi:hypothetical protein T439DRAFT_168652 [Meredithblackwellia eburnea MCA 4105]
MPVRTLKQVSLALLKLRIRDIVDVGALPYSLISDVLLHPGLTTHQLRQIEHNSPHLWPETEGQSSTLSACPSYPFAHHAPFQAVWKEHCIRAFIEVRIAIEDNLPLSSPPSEEQGGWRALFDEQEQVQDRKLRALEERLRDSKRNYEEGRASSKQVDGVRAEKKRKIGSHPGTAAAGQFSFSILPLVSIPMGPRVGQRSSRRSP